MLLEHMRKNQRWLMILITVLVVISFAYFFNRAEIDKLGRDQVAKIYGRNVTMTELDRVRRMFGVGYELGLTNLVSQEVADERDFNYAWNAIVIQKQAERMGLQPSDDEVAEAIQRAPNFQTAGKFDPKKFEDYISRALGSKGFGLRQVEEVVRLDLQVGRLKQMLEATAVAGPAEVRALFDEAHSKVDAQVIRLKLAEFASGVQVSDEDVKKTYEDPKKKDSYQQDAKRKVKYVKLELTEDEKKLTGTAKKDALQRIATKMEALADAMLEANADLAKVAAGLEIGDLVKETAEFDKASLSGQPEAGIPGFVQAALALTNESKTSDVVQGADAYTIMSISSWTPARRLTLEEAKPLIVNELQQERARVALDARMAEVRTKVVEAMKAGKTFEEAATAAGVKADTFPSFSLSEPNFEAPDASAVIQGSLELADGQLGKPQTTPEGSALVFVLRRNPADEAKFETMKVSLATGLASRRRSLAMREWLRVARTEAGLNQTAQLRN